MRQLIYLLILSSVLSACSNPKNTSDKKDAKHDKVIVNDIQQDKSDIIKITYDVPVTIDNTPYVMYPLIIEKKDGDEDYLSRGSGIGYWNIIFYNTELLRYQMLDAKRKMIIHSYSINNTSYPSSYDQGSATGSFQPNKVIYFSVTTFDYNADGKITAEDPKYLFMSDKSGNNFTQISPDSLNVTKWQTIKGSNKILIESVRDTNKDFSFDDQDETIPLIFDLSTGKTSKEVFSKEFRTSVKKLFTQNWPQKK